MLFFRSFSSEWLKTRRTAASWMVIAGSLLIPVIILFARLLYPERLARENASPAMWHELMSNCWQFMAIFLLPMGVILATSLITQNEFRNNTWKQLHTTPQHPAVIFTAKLSVIIVMLAQFFLLYNIGIYFAGIVPGLFYSDVPWPAQPYPLYDVLLLNANYFVCCLPVVALQFLVSLQFRNFMIPLSAGIGLLISALIALQWEYGYIHPYAYSGLAFLHAASDAAAPVNTTAWAAVYFFAFIAAAFVLYSSKKEKA
jgi:hypothetical protein